MIFINMFHISAYILVHIKSNLFFDFSIFNSHSSIYLKSAFALLRILSCKEYTIKEANHLRVTNEPSSSDSQQLTSSRVMSCYWDDKGSPYVHTKLSVSSEN